MMPPCDYKEEGNRHFGERRWHEAIEQYTLGLGDSAIADDARGLLFSNRSQCWLNLESWERARDDADACLRLLPTHTKSYLRRGNAYEQLGKRTEALADYARVAKVEPRNHAAVDAARRLREQVMDSAQKQRDDVLPANLLEVLRKDEASSAEVLQEKVDACEKLKALCVRKGLAGALLRLGAMELLVGLSGNEETPQELRASALGVLLMMASGHESHDDEDDARPTQRTVDGPLPVEASTADSRKRLCDLLPLETLRRLCQSDAKSMRQFVLILGHTHKPEDTEALEAIAAALLFTEGGEVDAPRGAIVALTTMLDTRRRLGKHGKPLMPSRLLLTCLESALSVASCNEHVRGLMATVFALLADTDRPKNEEVDLAAIGLKILEPFLQSEDTTLKANGLAGLSSLFAASSQAATQLLHTSPVPLAALLSALSRPAPGPDGRLAQNHAAECLLLTTGDLKTRQHFIDGGGIDMLLGALGDGEEGREGLIRAKLMGVLSMLAAHNAEVREEVFERMDFLMELRHALEEARKSMDAARTGGAGAPKIEEARTLARGLYESLACLTIHGEFKEAMLGAKKTLKAMHNLVIADDLMDDKNLSFLYTSLAYNLCRSREDKVRPKKDQFPFNELGEDDLKALEEFYEKLPAESRPVKNGEVDPGSPELAAQLRDWCVLHSGDTAYRQDGGRGDGGSARGVASASVVSHLAKCVANGSQRSCNLAALTFRFLCTSKEHRRYVVAGGGVRALLGLVDIEDEPSRDAARQALAQICIVTNPALLQYSEQLDAVRPLVQTLENKHELLQFEAAMGLTNLLIVGDELRTRALQSDAWRACRDLLFSDNEQVQRAGIEAMCNFTMAPEIIERFADGKAEVEIRIFLAFCLAEDKPTKVAATGALAMLAAYEEVAGQIAAHERFENLFELLAETTDPAIQHRVVACICSVCASEKTPPDALARAKAALGEKRRAGFASGEAEALARNVLVGMGGA